MNAYFDIFSGISGNMVLGALVDLGLDLKEWKKELAKLGLEDEYNIETKKTDKHGIGGTYLQVKLVDTDHDHSHNDNHNHEHGHNHSHKHNHDHSHDHDHSHGRNLDDIRDIIDKSDLSESIKEKSKKIFLNLAKAEAKIHGSNINEIHFHEVGAVDAIVDIVGSVLGLEMLGVDKIYASKLHIGNGFVECDHG